MKLSVDDFDFLNSFDHQGQFGLDEYKKNVLDLFILKCNANEFDYVQLNENLLDPLINFSVSRKVKEKYKAKPGKLSKRARQKFKKYLENKGELGELFLYSFLESHLKAPKILSKLELKTSTSLYVNGADGVHFLRMSNGDFQIIFGESKTEESLSNAIKNAFQSIYDFKNETNVKGQFKSGLPYEKLIISDHLDKETFTEEEKNFIESIIIPKKENDFNIDDAFGIFIGYEVNIDTELKSLPNVTFRERISEQIKNEIESQFDSIREKIKSFDLSGHHFYLYVLPFSNLKDNRMKVTKHITT